MTKKIIWRLKEQPSSESLRELVKDGILTKEEAREILFSNEDQQDRDAESLKSEIKFLRELVEKLSNKNSNAIIETIRYIEKPYKLYPWYQPYSTWGDVILCNTTSCGTTTNGVTGNDTVLYGNASITVAASDFTSIKTF